MSSVRKIARVAVAAPFVAVARILLVVWSSGRWTQQADFSVVAQTPPPTILALRAMPWAAAVSSAAARLPGSKCIVQALALKWILNCFRIPALMRVGVARQSGGAFVSHAWLEVDGVRVLDTAPSEAHLPLRVDA